VTEAPLCAGGRRAFTPKINPFHGPSGQPLCSRLLRKPRGYCRRNGVAALGSAGRNCTAEAAAKPAAEEQTGWLNAAGVAACAPPAQRSEALFLFVLRRSLFGGMNHGTWPGSVDVGSVVVRWLCSDPLRPGWAVSVRCRASALGPSARAGAHATARRLGPAIANAWFRRFTGPALHGRGLGCQASASEN